MDEMDLAQVEEVAMQKEIEARRKAMQKEKVKRQVCEGCGANLHEARQNHGFRLCVECQEELEREERFNNGNWGRFR